MSNIDVLSHKIDRLTTQVGGHRQNWIPCLVPPPHLSLFTEPEQSVLLGLEQRIMPFIPTGRGTLIEQLGGAHLSLFAICMPVYMALERMGVLDEVAAELDDHERWILPRWWWLYKDLVTSTPQHMIAHKRRHILRTKAELIESFLRLDLDLNTLSGAYPLGLVGYKEGLKMIERGEVYWYHLEAWYDFADAEMRKEEGQVQI